MKNLCATIAIISCVFSCVQSRATTLTWQFPQQVGARYEIRTFSRVTQKEDKPMIGFEGQFDNNGRSSGKSSHYISKDESCTTEKYVFTIEVLQKIAGGLRCLLTLRDWHMHLSEKENGKPSMSWVTWNKSISPAGKILSGTSFVFLLKDGKVSGVSGLETFRHKLMTAAKARRNNELMNIAENRFSLLYWQGFLDRWVEGTNTKKLLTGSRWQFTRPASLLWWQPLTVSRTISNISSTSATLHDDAIIDVDTTPVKSHNYRDTAIYSWQYKGSYQNNWSLDWSQGWKLQTTGVTQWRGHALIYGASKQGDISLLSDTPTVFREETRLVATQLL